MSGMIKPWLVLAVIFIAGGLSGSALTMALSAHFMHPPGPATMQRHIIARLTRELALSPEQQGKIEPIVRDATEKIEKLHREEFGQVSQILKSTDEQIAAILTPEQNTELKKMEAERENTFSGHMKPWGAPGDMHFHGGPDGSKPPEGPTPVARPGDAPTPQPGA